MMTSHYHLPDDLPPSPLKTVDCTNAHLAKVPVNISRETQAILLARNSIKPEDISNFPGVKDLVLLDLSSNHFYTLEESRLVAPSLTHLFLDRDELDYLSNRIFTGVLHLQFLSIADNKIEIIHSNTFDGLHQLQSLSLSHNRIFAVNPSWFQDLQSLVKLDLTGNNIHVLWNQGFRFLTGLKTMVLSNNRLNHIYDEAFMGLLELEELFLDSNHLKEIPSSAFQYFPYLEVLDLSGNHFKQLMERSFEAVNVSRIRLCNIKELEFIDRHAFVSLPYLSHLEMTNNRALMFIHREAFRGVTSLEQMFLQNCSLLTLEGGIAQSLPRLRLINLKGNGGINCDCTWSWLRGFVSDYISDSLSQDSRTNSSSVVSPSVFSNSSSSNTNINITKTAWFITLNSSAISARQSNLSVAGLDNAFCKFPGELNGVMLSSFIKSENLSTACVPRIVPLMPMELNTVLGEDVMLSCRGYGQPSPRVYWVSLESESKPTSPKANSFPLSTRPPLISTTTIPDSLTLPAHTLDTFHNQSTETDAAAEAKINSPDRETGVKIIPVNADSRIRVNPSGTLRLDYVQGNDSGLYKCVAENSLGRAEHLVKIHVRTVLADVVIVHVSSRSITVTWKSAVYDRDFQLFYKPKETNDTYKIVDLRPYMRTYTGTLCFWAILSKKSKKHRAVHQLTLPRVFSPL